MPKEAGSRYAPTSGTTRSFTFYTLTQGPDWRGPFQLLATWEDGQGWTHRHEQEGFHAGPMPLVIPLGAPRPQYRVRMTLNGDLVYLCAFQEPTEAEVLF